MKILSANRMERCIGCYSCSLACARLVHKRLSWQRAGIRIHSAGGLSAGYEARVCVACDPAPCVAVCPTDALRQRKGGGARVRLTKCVHCGACAPACPVNAIYMDIETDEPVLCYHCGQCVGFCPHDCLEMVSPDRFGDDDDQDDE